jgi:hypothetical protein
MKHILRKIALKSAFVLLNSRNWEIFRFILDVKLDLRRGSFIRQRNRQMFDERIPYVLYIFENTMCI